MQVNIFDREMSYDIDKRRKAESRWLYINKYHEWLKEQRKRDKNKLKSRWFVEKGNLLLQKNICPYCKNQVQIKRFDNLTQKICEKHGVVQILVRKPKGEKKK